jgi:hypothetical protein
MLGEAASQKGFKAARLLRHRQSLEMSSAHASPASKNKTAQPSGGARRCRTRFRAGLKDKPHRVFLDFAAPFGKLGDIGFFENLEEIESALADADSKNRLMPI